MRYYGITDIGNVRKQNQDTFYCEEIRMIKSVVAIVCDGMGGAKSGDVASKTAVDAFVKYFDNHFDPFWNDKTAAKVLAHAAEEANHEIILKGKNNPEFAGMGTTLVGATVIDGKVVVVNVGDSRAYLIGRSGIRQITFDHSVVGELLRHGDITKEQAKNHPNKNLITKALGSNRFMKPDTFSVTMNDGDRLLLCSDGLTNVVDDDEIFRIVTEEGTPETACSKLLERVKERGAPDNVTIVICEN